MRKVLHFPSPRERYKCDAAVVWCYDHRFEMALRKLLKRLGIERSDPIRVAGGAKSLAHPDKESDREFILEQLRWSMRLHGTDNVLLMVHSDCGAYGGLPAFKNDPEQEREHLKAELVRAVAVLKTAIPELSVRTYFVDFEGVWEPVDAPA
jgi:carbonic anhydrase